MNITEKYLDEVIELQKYNKEFYLVPKIIAILNGCTCCS